MPETYADVKLKEVVLSFPELFEPKAAKGSTKLKYSASFIMDNTKHGALLDQIENVIERVALDEFKKKVRFTSPLRDGNEYEDTKGYGDGTSFLSAKRDTRPAVVDRAVNPVTESDGIFYPGCIVNASIRFFAYDHPTGGKGVSCELKAVQFVRDGENLGGGGPIDPNKEFEKLEDDGATSTRSNGSTRSSGRSTRSSGAPAKSSSLDDF